jgi:hypothetical protein
MTMLEPPAVDIEAIRRVDAVERRAATPRTHERAPVV